MFDDTAKPLIVTKIGGYLSAYFIDTYMLALIHIHQTCMHIMCYFFYLLMSIWRTKRIPSDSRIYK